jgi:hypothetical protein
MLIAITVEILATGRIKERPVANRNTIYATI